MVTTNTTNYGLIRTVQVRNENIPGVAEICRAIHAQPSLARRFTLIGSTVAIVTDGTAVLGLRNIGLRPSN